MRTGISLPTTVAFLHVKKFCFVHVSSGKTTPLIEAVVGAVNAHNEKLCHTGIGLVAEAKTHKVQQSKRLKKIWRKQHEKKL